MDRHNIVRAVTSGPLSDTGTAVPLWKEARGQATSWWSLPPHRCPEWCYPWYTTFETDASVPPFATIEPHNLCQTGRLLWRKSNAVLSFSQSSFL